MAEVLVPASVWHCLPIVSHSGISSLASSAWIALLAPLVVSSALYMLSIFQSGPKCWRDWCSQCQLSSGLSEVLCQIPLPAGPAGSKEINQEKRLGRGDTLCALTVFLLVKDLLCDLCLWSFYVGNVKGSWGVKFRSLCGFLASDKQLSLLLSLFPGVVFSE